MRQSFEAVAPTDAASSELSGSHVCRCCISTGRFPGSIHSNLGRVHIWRVGAAACPACNMAGHWSSPVPGLRGHLPAVPAAALLQPPHPNVQPGVCAVVAGEPPTWSPVCLQGTGWPARIQRIYSPESQYTDGLSAPILLICLLTCWSSLQCSNARWWRWLRLAVVAAG